MLLIVVRDFVLRVGCVCVYVSFSEVDFPDSEGASTSLKLLLGAWALRCAASLPLMGVLGSLGLLRRHSWLCGRIALQALSNPCPLREGFNPWLCSFPPCPSR